MSTSKTLGLRTARRARWVVGTVLLAALAWLADRHIGQLRHGDFTDMPTIAAASFCWLAAMLVLAHLNRDERVPDTGETRSVLDTWRVVVVVPVYNEDAPMFAEMLRSLSAQTRLPAAVHIVDDGSAPHASRECRAAFDRWYATERPAALEAGYTWQPNAGKRHAQARAVRADLAADIYVTVDSDVRLDPRAIECGLMPFARRRTMSVAGMLLGLNHRANLLTRLVELGFVSSFLNGRSWYSAMGSVTVNAGGFALYRAHILQDNLGHYLRQTVCGRTVASGDDAMLTRYALLAGRTVFQRSAFGYTLHPTGIRHLTKQRVRWARSYWWGNWWFLKHFPARRIAWWLITFDVVSTAWMAIVIPMVFIVLPVRHGAFNPGLLLIIAMLSYIQNVRYLSVRRTDEPYLSQLTTFALAPVGALLQLYLGWMLQFAGLFTFAAAGWSTRTNVEVGLEASAGA